MPFPLPRRTAARLCSACLAAAFLLPCLGAPPVAAGDLECRVTAAYLSNFAAYISWPEDSFPSGYFEIMVDEDAPCLEAVKTLDGTTLQGLPARVRVRGHGDSLPPCNLWWTTSAPPGDVVEPARGCLAVGPGIDFARFGGGIGLYEKGKKLRFVVNVETLKRAHLSPSSKLLRVGEVLQ